jgi:mono/diheme cytochrome c family protein
MVIPGLVGAALVSLPFVDRSSTRDPRRRLWVLVGAAAGFGGVISLGLLAARGDSRNPVYVRQRAEATEKAEVARKLALQGVPAEGGVSVFRNDPLLHAREIWDERCAGCHSLAGNGGDKGPDFKGYNSREWILSFLKDPDDKRHMGPAKIEKGMRPVQGTPDELAALAEFVYAQTGAKDADLAMVQRGMVLFSEKDCDSCHDLDGESENVGPNLKGRGTPAYVAEVISDAGAGRLFNKKNKMPKFANKLSRAEIEEMARFVIRHRDLP